MNDVYYKIEITAKKLFNQIRVHLFLLLLFYVIIKISDWSYKGKDNNSKSND